MITFKTDHPTARSAPGDKYLSLLSRYLALRVWHANASTAETREGRRIRAPTEVDWKSRSGILTGVVRKLYLVVLLRAGRQRRFRKAVLSAAGQGPGQGPGQGHG